MTFSAPEPLTAAHDAAQFDCGVPSLNEWLQKHALKNQESGAARTFVVCVGNRVVAYYALAAGSVNHESATRKVRRNMPEPVPVALLGRLAVDRTAHGFGVGAGLLKDAVLRVLNAAQALGIRAIMVDALDDRAKTFYERFGFRGTEAFPLKMMITLEEAERALGVRK